MLINKHYLESLKPCTNRWTNYLKSYEGFEGRLSEFLTLDKISLSDKSWVLNKSFKHLPENLCRHFAFACASRAVDKCGIKEVEHYFNTVILIYESGYLDLLNSDEYMAVDNAARRAARKASEWASYRAVDNAARRAAHKASEWAVFWATHETSGCAAFWEAYSVERHAQIDYLIELLKKEGL